MTIPSQPRLTTLRLAVVSAVLAFGLCGYVSMDLCGGAFRGALITGVIVAVVDAIILAVAGARIQALVARLLVAALVLAATVNDSRLTAPEVLRIIFNSGFVPESVTDVRFRRVMPKLQDDYIYLDFCTDEATLQSLLAIRGFNEDQDFWSQWEWRLRHRDPEDLKEFWSQTMRYADDPNFPDQSVPVPSFAKSFTWEAQGILLGVKVIWIPETGRAVVMYSNG